jgi:hypothetical protein
MYQPTAIEAHLSSTRQQREERTTNTQTPALSQYAERHRYAFHLQRQFQEEGDRGIRWFRPNRKAVHDLVSSATCRRHSQRNKFKPGTTTSRVDRECNG